MLNRLIAEEYANSEHAKSVEAARKLEASQMLLTVYRIVRAEIDDMLPLSITMPYNKVAEFNLEKHLVPGTNILHVLHDMNHDWGRYLKVEAVPANGTEQAKIVITDRHKSSSSIKTTHYDTASAVEFILRTIAKRVSFPEWIEKHKGEGRAEEA